MTVYGDVSHAAVELRIQPRGWTTEAAPPWHPTQLPLGEVHPIPEHGPRVRHGLAAVPVPISDDSHRGRQWPVEEGARVVSEAPEVLWGRHQSPLRQT